MKKQELFALIAARGNMLIRHRKDRKLRLTRLDTPLKPSGYKYQHTTQNNRDKYLQHLWQVHTQEKGKRKNARDTGKNITYQMCFYRLSFDCSPNQPANKS
jgi:hypothetical protein